MCRICISRLAALTFSLLLGTTAWAQPNLQVTVDPGANSVDIRLDKLVEAGTGTITVKKNTTFLGSITPHVLSGMPGSGVPSVEFKIPFANAPGVWRWGGNPANISGLLVHSTTTGIHVYATNAAGDPLNEPDCPPLRCGDRYLYGTVENPPCCLIEGAWACKCGGRFDAGHDKLLELYELLRRLKDDIELLKKHAGKRSS